MKEMIFSNILRKDKSIKNILPKLLKDQTTRKNIVWATDTYEAFYDNIKKENQMLLNETIKLIDDGIMLPRIMKTKEQQEKRTKNKGTDLMFILMNIRSVPLFSFYFTTIL